jgi:hypothetical protein
MGLGSPSDLKNELGRLLASLQDHLGHSIASLEGLPVRKVEPRGSLANALSGGPGGMVNSNGLGNGIGGGHGNGAGSGGSSVAGAIGVGGGDGD